MSDQIAAPDAASADPNDPGIEIVERSDVGRVRTENQDFAITATRDGDRGRSYLLVVADGMGGHRGGATASRIAGTTIRDRFMDGNIDRVPRVLREALSSANRNIFSESERQPELRGMGTTCSTLVIRGSRGWLGHVGDSRIYLIRDGQIRALTDDHSLVASMVREGLLTEEEAEVHPRRNVLQRSMGVAEEVEIDISEAMDIHPGDRYLLCSDGLYGLVKEPEILEIGGTGPLAEAVDALIELALERGAHDNVTVIMAAVNRVPPYEEDPEEESSEAATLEEPLDEDETSEFPTAPDPSASDEFAPDAGEAPDDSIAVSEAGPGAVAEAKPRGSALKWIVIVLLAAAAVGAAVLYWNEDWVLSLLR